MKMESGFGKDHLLPIIRQTFFVEQAWEITLTISQIYYCPSSSPDIQRIITTAYGMPGCILV